MVEQQRQRVEQEMTKLVDDIDKQFLRKMQVSIPSYFQLIKLSFKHNLPV